MYDERVSDPMVWLALLQLVDADVQTPQFQFVKRMDLQPDDAFGACAVLFR